jgi:hypothetical protein
MKAGWGVVMFPMGSNATVSHLIRPGQSFIENGSRSHDRR